MLTDADLIKIGYEALVETYARHPRRFTLRRRAIKIMRRMLTERGVSNSRSNFLIKCAEQQWDEASRPFIAKHKQVPFPVPKITPVKSK
jgi:hypothetical protein